MQFAKHYGFRARRLFSFFIDPYSARRTRNALERATGLADLGTTGGIFRRSVCDLGKLDPSALRYVALSPHAKGLARICIKEALVLCKFA